MKPTTFVAGRENPIAALRRLARPGHLVQERCELCSLGLGSQHRHLWEVSSRRLVCACDGCALRFERMVGGRFKLIPRDTRALPAFHMSDAQWESLALPIELVFFVSSSVTGQVTAFYPSPAGATESLLALENWNALRNENPELARLEPDVEALLINRSGSVRAYFLTPIDKCFELVALIRLHWRGLSGGEVVWQQVEAFFRGLRDEAGTDQPEAYA